MCMTTDHGKLIWLGADREVHSMSVCSQQVSKSAKRIAQDALEHSWREAQRSAAVLTRSSSACIATLCAERGCKLPTLLSMSPVTCLTHSAVSNGNEPHIHAWRRDHSNPEHPILELPTIEFPHRDIWAISSFDNRTMLGKSIACYCC